MKWGTVKHEHSIIAGIQPLLKDIATLPEVTRVIPGRIERARASRRMSFTVQYETDAGLKCLAKGGAVQEVFVVTGAPEKARSAIEDLVARHRLDGR